MMDDSLEYDGMLINIVGVLSHTFWKKIGIITITT